MIIVKYRISTRTHLNYKLIGPKSKVRPVMSRAAADAVLSELRMTRLVPIVTFAETSIVK